MDVLSAEVLQAVRRVEVRTRRPVCEMLLGRFRSAFRGNGIEFAEVREYQPGDDVRAIDWNVTARSGKPFVKQFVEERQQRVVFAVDASASMRCGAGVRSSWETALEVVAALLLSAAMAGDRVGLAVFAEQVECFLPPRTGTRYAYGMIHELVQHYPRARSTDLAGALAELSVALRRRAVVFVVSDFEVEGWEPEFAALACKHEVVAVRVGAPLLGAHGARSRFLFEDAESGERRLVDLRRAADRERIRTARRALDCERRSRIERSGADLVELVAGEAPWVALARFLEQRLQRRGW